MERALLRIVLLLHLSVVIFAVSAAPRTVASGRVVDPEGTPVAYATVVLLDAERQLAGTATASDGSFSFEAPAGRYRLTIRYLGYETLVREVDTPGDLGEFVLRPAAVEMEEVVVKTDFVRREADRFVMEVAGSPAAVGKDGTELLRQAPGVWLSDDKIAINGATGAKVYIDDREVRLSTEQLLDYLRGLKAEEIRRIEIIPQAGADCDADSAAGIIKIALKRKRDNGLSGDLSFSTRQSGQIEGYNPSFSLNGRAGRWTFNASGWAEIVPLHITRVTEHTEYRTSDARLDAASEMRGRNDYGGGRAGVICDISERHSIGAEADFYLDRDHSPNRSSTDLSEPLRLTRNESFYDGRDRTNTFSATFNYVWRIDTLGSTLKVMADYSRNDRRHGNDSFVRSTAAGVVRDSTYDDRTRGLYDVAAFNVALERRLGEAWQLRAGAKYTYNDMHNEALYRYLHPEGWRPLDAYSYDTDYTERIAAAYAAATLKKGRWNVVAGLRGEYTRTTGYASDVRQRYFSLFPSANLSYSFDAAGRWSLTAQYGRSISRPSFWALNPMRMQVSDYTYQSGNPDLLPAYTDNLSLTMLFAATYSLSIGAQLHHDEIAQVFGSDAADPSITNLRYENLDRTELYFASASLPLQLAKWWTLNANLTALCRRDRIAAAAPLCTTWSAFASASTLFTLPHKFFLEVLYDAQSRYRQANLDMKSWHSFALSLKKRLLDNRLTLTAQVDNLFDSSQRFVAATDAFVRSLRVSNDYQPRRFVLKLNYNFKTGKTFRARKVESGAADEKNRM